MVQSTHVGNVTKMDVAEIALSANAEATYDFVAGHLREFNRGFLGPYEALPIAVHARSAAGEIIAGAAGVVKLGWLFVDVLWVPQSLRGSGLGSRIMDQIEAEAARRGATHSVLDTMGFQAEGFYLKRGYAECGRIPSFANGFDRIYMTKKLVD